MRKKTKSNLIKYLIVASIAGIMVGVGTAYLASDKFLVNSSSYPQVGIGGGPGVYNSSEVEKTVEEWPVESRRIAIDLLSKYGEPDDYNRERLVWNFNAPWEKTVVHREAKNSSSTNSANYFLEQTINYQVPDNKFDLLVTEDGSVSMDKNEGELIARSNSEALNFLALNLTNDILKNNQSVEQAKKDYSSNRQMYMNGENVPYALKFQFNVPPAGRTREPGETIMR